MSQSSRRRPQRAGATQWQHWLDKQARSGLSQHAFCKQQGLAYSTFTRWKRQLSSPRLPASSSPASSDGLFTEVAAPQAEHVASGFDFELDVGRVFRLRWRRH